MSKVKKGQKAIQFVGTDLQENRIDLNDFKGKKVLLSFFRKAACPFCNLAMQQLIRRHEELKMQEIEVIALFASSAYEVQRYAGKQNPEFPIIPDEHFKIYSRYGLETSYFGMLKTMLNPAKVWKAMKGGFFSLRTVPQDPVLPAEILINEDQEIHRAYYGKDYDDHLSVDEILAWESEVVSYSQIQLTSKLATR